MSRSSRSFALAALLVVGPQWARAGLLAYYSFDSDFTDASGQSNDLTAEPGTDPAITTDPGQVAGGTGALDLDGNDWLNLTNTLSFGPSDPWSVAFWVKRDAGAATQDGMILGEVGTSGNFIWTPSNPTVVQGLRFRNANGNNADYSGFPDDGAFHHWAVIAHGDGSVTVYRDNVSLGSRTPSGGTTFTASDVGHAFSSTGQIHFGQIDELYIYDEAIDATKVAELSGISTGPDETPPSLSGSNINDGSGSDVVNAGTAVTFTIAFSEDMDATTVSADDFGNGGTAPVTIENVTEISPGTFEVTVLPSAPGTLQLIVPQDAELLDPAGNALDTTVAIQDDDILTVVTPPEPVPLKRIRVVLLGGQSNAAGRGDSSGLPTSPVNLQAPQNDVDFYNGSLTALSPGSQFGPEITMGRTMTDIVGGSSGTRIAIIKYGVGGTSLVADWKAGGDETTSNDGPRYVTFQNRVTNGLAALASAYPGIPIELAGMLWVQGERDAKTGAENEYEANLTAFIEDVRLTYGADLPFIISRLSINQTNIAPGPLEVVRAAQSSVAASDDRNVLLDTDGFGMLGDNLHFDAQGQQEIGNVAALQLLSFFPFESPPGFALDSGNDPTLTVNDPLPGFLYTLQSSATLEENSWTDLESIVAASSLIVFELQNFVGATNRFVRIKRSIAP